MSDLYARIKKQKELQVELETKLQESGWVLRALTLALDEEQFKRRLALKEALKREAENPNQSGLKNQREDGRKFGEFNGG